MPWLRFMLGFACQRTADFWIPAFAGMTGLERSEWGCRLRFGLGFTCQKAADFWIPAFAGMTELERSEWICRLRFGLDFGRTPPEMDILRISRNIAAYVPIVALSIIA